ncbi:MAG: type IX secretion system membrane protein PorP/SprF [Cytophagales bacterium]|nr:type IX secretion system membrane protein PorP/SprF [Cytophagales bacterium]
MKNFIHTFLLIIFFNSISLSLLAQDPGLSQFYSNPVYLNPANAGTGSDPHLFYTIPKTNPRIIMNSRIRWPKIKGNFSTNLISYDQYMKIMDGGLGFIAMYDRSSQYGLSETSLSAMYSYFLQLNKNIYVNAGFQTSIYQKHLDWHKFTFDDMIDERSGFVNPTNELPPASLNKIYPDFSTGLLFHIKAQKPAIDTTKPLILEIFKKSAIDILTFIGGYNIGIVVHHITKPQNGFYGISRLQRKFTIHTSGKIPIPGRFLLRKGTISERNIYPNILYQKQGDFQLINYGFYFRYETFIAGLWHRYVFTNSDSFVILIGYQISGFKFLYSYDHTISKLTNNATTGSHELSISLGLQIHRQFGEKPHIHVQ